MIASGVPEKRIAGEAASPGQAAVSQVEHGKCSASARVRPPPLMACRGQENSMQIADGDNPSGGLFIPWVGR